MARSSRRGLLSSRGGLGVRGVVILCALALTVAGWLYVNRPATAPDLAARSVLDAIPDGAMLIAVVDVTALRGTPLGKRFLGQGRTIAGLGEVAKLCGADPMDAVDELAVAVPTSPELGGFGVFATGSFQSQQLLSCAEKIVVERGGRPVRQERDGFDVLRDVSMSLSSAELAVANGGPLVLGEPPYVKASLAKAAARAAGRHDAAHAALRALVAPGVVVATVVLSGEQRDTLLDELRAQNMADSPFQAVTSGALSVSLDQRLRIHAVIRCQRPDACLEIADLANDARREEASSLSARAIGLSAVLEEMSIRAVGSTVHVRSSVPLEDALALLRRVLALRKLGRRLDALPEPTGNPPDPAALPDAGVRVEASADKPRPVPVPNPTPRPGPGK